MTCYRCLHVGAPVSCKAKNGQLYQGCAKCACGVFMGGK